MCSYTPRFSYTVSKTVICACASWSTAALVGGCTGWYRVGYGTGWVPGRGNTGVYPAAKDVPVKRSMDSGAGPGSPSRGLEWVVHAQRPSTSAPTLRARSCPCRALPGAPRAKAASGPIGARFDLISVELSQNDEVSPKYPEKASHSPYFQNGLRMSPLDFLRFPFSPAFSGKELMVPFWA